MDSEKGYGKVELPRFDGTHKSFLIWWMRFSAYAAVWGFSHSIGKTKDPVLPALKAIPLLRPQKRERGN